MKKILLLLIVFLGGQNLFGQGVGINTTTPDQSAALEIKSDNKGMLIPRVSLQSITDGNTVSSPATALLVYNTNIALPSGSGFYFNAGGKGGLNPPNWKSLSDKLELPYYNVSSNNSTLFQIDSYSQSPTSTAIKGFHGGSGTGVSAFSSSGLGLDVSGGVKISGNGQSPGVGKVLTSDANGNATWEGAVAFRASGVKGGGSEKIAKYVTTKIPFATKEYDLGSNYNDANVSPHSTFITPSDGIYHFDIKVSWLHPSGQEVPTYLSLTLRMLRNGVVSTITTDDQSSEGGSQCKISTDVKLLKNDQLFVEVYQTSQDYMDLYVQSTVNYFDGRLVIKQ